MDLTAAAEIGAAVRAASAVVVRGSGTHEHVGDRIVGDAAELRAPAGIVRHEPADLTVTVHAGTPFAELRDALAASGQEVPLDPDDARATVGGTLATGLTGPRRLGLGPIRDTLLEVHFVDGRGTVVRGGGPTVKNVSGYDIPRLMVGSLGTLGIIVTVTLRCRPIAPARAWSVVESDDPESVRAGWFRPTACLWNGTHVHTLREGHPVDLDEDTSAPVAPPVVTALAGRFRGRISVPAAAVVAVSRALPSSVPWWAELGVGTIRIATDDADAFAAARVVAEANDGWLLRESAGPEGTSAFGTAMTNATLQQRIKDAFDPDHKLAPGRFPW